MFVGYPWWEHIILITAGPDPALRARLQTQCTRLQVAEHYAMTQL